jgi:antitoxin MazE
MITRLVRIGNSHGIRIPKPLIEQAGLKGKVELTLQDNALVIRPAVKPRAGWASAFREMANRGEDVLLDDVVPQATSWDEDEWQWQ